MRKRKTEPFWCSAAGTLSLTQELRVASLSQRQDPHFRGHLTCKTFPQLLTAATSTQRRFVNSEKLLHILPSLHFTFKKKKEGDSLCFFCLLKKNVLFYNYSTCEITLTTQAVSLSQPLPLLRPARAPAIPGPPSWGAGASHSPPVKVSEAASLGLPTEPVTTQSTSVLKVTEV